MLFADFELTFWQQVFLGGLAIAWWVQRQAAWAAEKVNNSPKAAEAAKGFIRGFFGR
jgi:hypothetical protein